MMKPIWYPMISNDIHWYYIMKPMISNGKLKLNSILFNWQDLLRAQLGPAKTPVPEEFFEHVLK